MGAEILSGKFPNSVSIAICLPLSILSWEEELTLGTLFRVNRRGRDVTKALC